MGIQGDPSNTTPLNMALLRDYQPLVSLRPYYGLLSWGGWHWGGPVQLPGDMMEIHPCSKIQWTQSGCEKKYVMLVG